MAINTDGAGSLSSDLNPSRKTRPSLTFLRHLGTWLCGPATITIGDDNNGEIAFGALQAGLDVSYTPSMAFFTWDRCD
ncbi:hypothetical protein WHT83_10260 [Aminobacter sp. P9b]|uniref:hypothetical protein n=1 Tax=Aminobacter sp. P9b TaxID=3133697 RepID=UPI00324DD98D